MARYITVMEPEHCLSVSRRSWQYLNQHFIQRSENKYFSNSWHEKLYLKVFIEESEGDFKLIYTKYSNFVMEYIISIF